MELPSLISSFSLIDDRRSNKNKRYPLPLLLLIAFCASISTSHPISIPDCDMIYHLDLRQRARSDRGLPFLRLKHPSGRPAAPEAETEECDV